MALRRLKRDGLVAVRQAGRVQLTAEGRKIARRLAIRHHLIERMLHEIFGMAWYKVHDEAERLEHAVSSDFEAMLSAQTGTRRALPARQSADSRTSQAASANADCCCFPRRSPDAAMRCKASMSAIASWESFWKSLGIRPGVEIAVHGRNYDNTLSLATPSGKVSLGQYRGRKSLGSSRQREINPYDQK